MYSQFSVYAPSPLFLRAIILWLSLGTAANVWAQPRFKAAIIAGMNASQINGDASAGFHKIGFQAGLRGVTRLKGKQEASIEILYSQRGARNEPYTLPLFNLTLNYIEVPVQWHYFDWPVYGLGSDEPLFYRVQLNAGLSFGRLLGYREPLNESGIRAALPHLRQTSVCGIVGATFYANKHLAFGMHYNRALNFLYRPGNGGNFGNALLEYFLTLQTLYFF
jgi:hypothetical protein